MRKISASEERRGGSSGCNCRAGEEEPLIEIVSFGFLFEHILKLDCFLSDVVDLLKVNM